MTHWIASQQGTICNERAAEVSNAVASFSSIRLVTFVDEEQRLNDATGSSMNQVDPIPDLHEPSVFQRQRNRYSFERTTTQRDPNPQSLLPLSPLQTNAC